MALYVWGSDTSGELGELKLMRRFWKFCCDSQFSGLGGTGIEDESINCPKKMQWEDSDNLKQAALGGQVGNDNNKEFKN